MIISSLDHHFAIVDKFYLALHLFIKTREPLSMASHVIGASYVQIPKIKILVFWIGSCHQQYIVRTITLILCHLSFILLSWHFLTPSLVSKMTLFFIVIALDPFIVEFLLGTLIASTIPFVVFLYSSYDSNNCLIIH